MTFSTHPLPRLIIRSLAWITLLATACQPAPAPTLTPLPTYDLGTAAASLCPSVDVAWETGDWPSVIKSLETVRQIGAKCDGQDPALKLYPAWYNYGAKLEAQGKADDAIAAYRRALDYNPAGLEAAQALKRQAAFTPMPLPTCPDDQVKQAQASMPTYQPAGRGGFVTIQGSGFEVDGAPLYVRGVNYYPAQAPWRRFLTDTTPNMVNHELGLIKAAGFNAIRIFLWYAPLFDCEGNGVVPNAAAFARLDSVIQLAAERGLRVLVTLNDLPDLTFHPLYSEPDAAAAQTEYIVTRYQHEPAILAWDLRNEGDIDYIRKVAPGRVVIDWLKLTSTAVRSADPNHLITAGWNDDAGSTRNAVDFISFHHWYQPGLIHTRVAAIREVSDKPILLEEIGYSARAQGEDGQADLLRSALQTAKAEGLAGWLIWSAFDFTPAVTCVPPACPGTDNTEHHFGLWHADYSPKSALEAVMGVP